VQTKLHFSRFEFKYILGQGQRRELEREFQYFVELDPYTAGKPGGKYFVRSLYFDNAAFRNYYEKVDGMKHRSKFRLRTYTGDQGDGTPQFLEIKGRHNNLVFKHRAPVAPDRDEDDTSPYNHPTTRRILGGLEAGPIKSQFRFDLARKALKPVMLVDYWRRPFVSKYDPEFRMTMDDTVSGTACDTLFPGFEAHRKLALPGYTILEVKFRFHMPKWFHRLVQSYELRRVSISKVCAAIDVHGLAEKLD
jgi:hypothetical protein